MPEGLRDVPSRSLYRLDRDLITTRALLGFANRGSGRPTVLFAEESGAAEKRPDLTPFFKAMDSLIEPLSKGRFLVVLSGNSEALIALYLRPSEQAVFRRWEERQCCGDAPAPVDWFKWFSFH